MSDRTDDTPNQEAPEASAEGTESPAEAASSDAGENAATAESAEPAAAVETADEVTPSESTEAEEATAEASAGEDGGEEVTESKEVAAEEQATAAEPEATESSEVAEPEEAQAEAAEAAEPEEATEAAAEPEAAIEAAEPEEAAEAAAEPEEAAEAAAEPEKATAEPAGATAEPEEAQAETAAEPEEAQAETAEAAAEPGEAQTEAAEAAAETAKPDEAQAAETADAAAAEAAKPAEAQADEAMAELEQALKDEKLVKGQVIGWNKGGYHVAVGKIAAFCPVSQIEIGNPRSPKRYLDKTFSFRIIEIQNGGRRVVLSRAEAIKAEREQRAALVRELLQPGAELEGKVSSLTDFGAFVDLGGGIEGLVHVSEISRRRVEHPKEALRSGQKVKVVVLKIEKGGQRISLSMKRLEPDPWKGAATRFPGGSEFTGKILRHTDFGVFVEVEPGLEGLIHTSRLAFGMTLSDERLEVGKDISGWIHEVESKRRRLSLSLREVVGGNPWQGINDRYPVGDIFKGTVERLTNFGVFIQLEPGLTGLLPFSVLGLSGGNNPRRQYHAGKEVSVRILGIDRDKKRISLGTESSKAEGNQQDYREYVKTQTRAPSGGLNAMAAAFAKLKEQQQAAEDQ